ncbi:MAG: metallophosphoesterase [Fibrobacteria bacterium]|nr:metallophosphoesterase [Fibrobacteria bacterium]
MWNGKQTAFILVIFLMAGHGLCGKIIYPWRATTAIVKAGESFTVFFDAESGESIDSVVLVGPYNRITQSSLNIETGDFVYDALTSAAYNTQITVPVEASAPSELYTLILYTTKGEQFSKSAVKVVKAYKTSYTIMHMSDTHISRHKKNGYAQELEWFTNLVDIANIIGPDLVFITGDCSNELTENGDFSAEERWDFVYNGHENLQGFHGIHSPVFTLPGNHDYYKTSNGAAYWNTHNGIRMHHFTFGESRYMVLDNSQGDDLAAQLSHHQSWLDSVGPGSFRGMAEHKTDRVDHDFLDNNNVQLIMEGHTHLVWQMPDQSSTGFRGTTPTLYSIPGSASNITSATGRDNIGWFRLLYVNGASVDTITRLQYADNTEEDPSQHNVKLRIEYSGDGEGNQTGNQASIINEFDQEFPNCLVRFVLPKGNYDVSAGTIEQVIQNDTVTVLDVRMDIQANSTVQCSVSVSDVQSVSDQSGVPESFTLFSFKGEIVSIPGSVGAREPVSIFDINGTLIKRIKKSGEYLTWDLTNKYNNQVQEGLYVIMPFKKKLYVTADDVVF